MVNINAVVLLSLSLCTSFIVFGQSYLDIGVCYGLNGNNLPSPKDVVNLYKSYGLKKMRIFEPYPEVLEALRGSDIKLTLGVLNQDIPILASGEAAAHSWFMSNVKPYVNNVNITYIGVGNEVIPGEFSESILLAMQNLQNVLMNNNLEATKATTVVHTGVLATSYPPSAGEFSINARPFISEIIRFLSSQKTPLLVNIYPYFPYASEPEHIQLDYALLSSSKPLVYDGSQSYTNLLDAMLDAFFSAMEKEGVNDLDLVISESGWPHAGNGNFTTPEFAATYNRNFIKRVNGGGTPKNPNAKIEGYVFAIIDEDMKEPGVEQHWGLFNPSMKPNYDLFN